MATKISTKYVEARHKNIPLADHLPDARKMVNLGFVRQPAVGNTTHRDHTRRMWSQIVTTSAGPYPDSSHTVMSFRVDLPLRPL